MAASQLTYDENSDLMRGKVLALGIKSGSDFLPVAFAKSYKIDIQKETIDTANLMSGEWKSFLTGQSSWTMSSDALVSKKDGHLSYKLLTEMMTKGAALEVIIGEVKKGAGTGGGTTWTLEEAKAVAKGKAVMTSLNVSGESGGVVELSISLTGSGELTTSMPTGIGAA